MRFRLGFSALAAICALAVLLTGCDKDAKTSSFIGDMTAVSAGTAGNNGNSSSDAADSVHETTISNAENKITFMPDGITASGAAVSGNTVNISKSGVYELTGKNNDCKIKIDADKNADITLVFNNAELACGNGSVIDCQKADVLTLFINEGTENALADSAAYSAQGEDDPDAAVFTRSDLVIKGGGALNITGNYKDAVKCKDAVTVYGGIINISAADDALTGKDSVTVNAGTLNIKAGGDGVKSTNDADEGKGWITVTGGKINIESDHDGIQSKKELSINGGEIAIVSGGSAADEPVQASSDNPWDHDFNGNSDSSENTESRKGLKAGGKISITGGEFNIKSADDTIHSKAEVMITDGNFMLSSCDDAIHAEEALTIQNGTITVTKSYEGLEGKSISIGGGTIDITAEDDGLNAAGGDNGSFFGFGQGSDEYFINITGGDITVNANGDGIDSNGTIAQSGGVITVFGPTSSMNGAIDYEMSYAMSGGTLTALGAVGMAQTPSTLSQPCLSVNANASAGSVIEVRSGSDVIISVTTPKNAQSLIFSSDKFVNDEEYGIYVNGELIRTLTAENGVVGDSFGGGPGGFGGGPGGFGGGHGGGNKPGGGFGVPGNGGFGAPNGNFPPNGDFGGQGGRI